MYMVRIGWYNPYTSPYDFWSEMFLSVESSSQNFIVEKFSKCSGTGKHTDRVALYGLCSPFVWMISLKNFKYGITILDLFQVYLFSKC